MDPPLLLHLLLPIAAEAVMIPCACASPPCVTEADCSLVANLTERSLQEYKEGKTPAG